MDKRISLNQFAEYSTVTRESAKLRIIRQQKEPDPNLIPWYQRAKSCIRKSLSSGGDLFPIYDGIEILTNKVPITKRQYDDKIASISALEQFLKMRLPNFIYEKNFEIVKLNRKIIQIKGLDISLSPDFVFKYTKSNGESVIGAMKIHVCKTKPFSFQTAEFASVVLYEFLKKVSYPGEIVDPMYCFTIDIFGERIAPTPLNNKDIIKKIEGMCEEIVKFWDAA